MQGLNKQQQIVEAATRRLAHFGMHKTNMADIAQDLGISKASLYYYFPDKTNLYAAVLSSIVEVEMKMTRETISTFPTCKERVMELLKRRTTFVKQYYTLLSGLAGEQNPLGEEKTVILASFRHRQTLLLQDILQKGVEDGEIASSLDLYETAQLFLVALEGMRFLILNDRDQHLFPSEEEFDKIHGLQQKMSLILLKGLSPTQ